MPKCRDKVFLILLPSNHLFQYSHCTNTLIQVHIKHARKTSTSQRSIERCHLLPCITRPLNLAKILYSWAKIRQSSLFEADCMHAYILYNHFSFLFIMGKQKVNLSVRGFTISYFHIGNEKRIKYSIFFTDRVHWRVWRLGCLLFRHRRLSCKRSDCSRSICGSHNTRWVTLWSVSCFWSGQLCPCWLLSSWDAGLFLGKFRHWSRRRWWWAYSCCTTVGGCSRDSRDSGDQQRCWRLGWVHKPGSHF